MKDYFTVIPAAYLLLEQDGKILLLQRANTGFEDGNYSLIAGHADGGETMTEVIIREAKEEAGIIVKPEDLREVVTMHRRANNTNPAHERVDFFFTAERWEGEPTNMEPHKCSELGWYPIGQLPENVIPYVREAIGCFQTDKRYVEWGFEK